MSCFSLAGHAPDQGPPPLNSLCSGLWMGTASEKGGIHAFLVPPESLTLSTRGPWQMPEAEGLEPHFQRCSPWQLRFLTRMSRSTFGETEAFPWGPQNLSTRPGGGNAARVERHRATFRLCLPPPLQSSPAAAPQEAPPKTKRCGFSPRLKSAASVPPTPSKSDSISPNKPPINQLLGRLLKHSADLGEWFSC